MNEINLKISEGAIDNSKYKKCGFNCAQVSQTDPPQIINGLNEALTLFRNDSILATKRRNESLKAEIVSLKEQRVLASTALKNEQMAVKAKEDEISSLSKQKEDIKDKKSDTSEAINVGLQIFGLIVLTLFLYIFYATVGFSILDDTKTSSTFLNLNVFTEASRKGGAAIVLVCLIPSLILAFGILIHWFLGKITKEQSGKKKSLWIILLVGFLLIAFCFDAIAGYKICQNTHIKLFKDRIITEAWHPMLAFKDSNFYLIIILGFVAYLVWGILLHALLSNPVFNHNDQIRRWEEKIEQAKSRLLEMKQSVNQKETVLQKLVETILSKEKCYSNYANGGIYYDVDNFRGVIGIFMEGYASYITPYYDDEKISKQVMSEAIRIQVEWEKKVINNFNTKQI